MNVSKELRDLADKIDAGTITPSSFFVCTPAYTIGTFERGFSLRNVDELRIQLVIKEEKGGDYAHN